jgi:accessory gene regulator protein AgrB
MHLFMIYLFICLFIYTLAELSYNFLRKSAFLCHLCGSMHSPCTTAPVTYVGIKRSSVWLKVSEFIHSFNIP